MITRKVLNSHVNENQLELLLNYYIRPRSNNIPIEQEAKETEATQRYQNSREIETEATQIIEINGIKTIDHEFI